MGHDYARKRLPIALMFMLSLCGCILSHAAVTTVSVQDYGARCDGNTDDTTAIQNALQSGYTVQIPQGTCVITMPLTIQVNSNFAALEGTSGNNSVLLADFSRWRGSAYVALELVTSAALPNVPSWSNRVFGNFSILSKAASSVQATAISMYSSTGVPEVNVSPFISSELKNLFISGFDTGIDIQEAWQSNFDSIFVSNCRMGINIHGLAVNLMFSKIQMMNFSNLYTSSTAETVGLELTTKTYSGSNVQAPQGVVFSNGLVFGAVTNVLVDAGLHIDISHNVIDGAAGNAVVVDNPNGLQLNSNWIATTVSSDSCVYVSSPATNLEGLWIQGNEIMGTPTAQVGIFFAPGTARRGTHIVDNRFAGVTNPMIFRETPQFSIIRNNTGSQNGNNSFMWLGPGGDYTEIEGNQSTDNQPIVALAGAASTIRIGYNASVAGTTGP